MAVIRKNEEYVKALINKAYIENGNLIVPLVFYKNKSARQFEKDNEEEIKDFFQKIENYTSSLQLRILEILTTLCHGTVNQEQCVRYAEEIANDSTYNELANEYKLIIEDFEEIKKYLNSEQNEEIQLRNKDFFIEMGLKAEWLENPIIIVRTGSVNIGVVSVETKIDGETIYSMLKTKMPDLEDDL